MQENSSVIVKSLNKVPLEDLATVLNITLKKNFDYVNAEVVDCPDLTKAPFTLAKPGLGGNAKLVELGGVPYLLPTVQRDKVYDLGNIAHVVKSNPAFIIGAGAGPFPFAKTNCEGIYNLEINNKQVNQQTRIVKVDVKSTEPLNIIQETLPNTETRIALLANLFFSEGAPGKVLKIHVKKRIGDDDFITSIRKSLVEEYPNHVIGMGGTFLMKEGKAKQHVMPDFSQVPLDNEDKLNNWLNFYEMSAPLINVGTLINSQYDLDLRVQHFHSFSHHGQGGHYHNDTTPETVEYLGYFNTGNEIYRIDKPLVTHQYGRD